MFQYFMHGHICVCSPYWGNLLCWVVLLSFSDMLSEVKMAKQSRAVMMVATLAGDLSNTPAPMPQKNTPQL